MPQLINKYSAIARCPNEIWSTILLSATHIPHWCDTDPLRPYERHNGKPRRRIRVLYDELSKRTVGLRNLRGVCVEWDQLLIPEVMKWRVINNDRDLIAMANAVAVPYGNTFCGIWVRSIELDLTEPGSPHQTACRRDMITQIITQCSQLEEFYIYCDANSLPLEFISVITSPTRCTLTELSLPANYPLSYQQVLTILSTPMRMKALIFAGPADLYGLAGTGRVGVTIESLSLRIVPGSSMEVNSNFVQFFTSLEMPALRSLFIACEADRKQPSSTSWLVYKPLLPYFLSLFESHGRRLRSLEIMEGPWNQAEAVSTFLSLCPNLEDLVFHNSWISVTPVDRPHPSLRRVAFVSSGADHFYASRGNIPQLNVVWNTFRVLCGPSFPQVCVIQSLDTPHERARGALALLRDEFRHIPAHARSGRRIRVEDLEGRLLYQVKI